MADPLEEMNRRIVGAINRLQARFGTVQLEVDFVSLLHVISNLQLALRHPGNTGPVGQSARGFLDQTIARLEEWEPELGPLLRAGDDARFDRPAAAIKKGGEDHG